MLDGEIHHSIAAMVGASFFSFSALPSALTTTPLILLTAGSIRLTSSAK
jgi:hypothetical protein